jgi:hypothetical protein
MASAVPPPDTKRWVARCNAVIVNAVRSGAISPDQECRPYHLDRPYSSLLTLRWREADSMSVAVDVKSAIARVLLCEHDAAKEQDGNNYDRGSGRERTQFHASMIDAVGCKPFGDRERTACRTGSDPREVNGGERMPRVQRMPGRCVIRHLSSMLSDKERGGAASRRLSAHC